MWSFWNLLLVFWFFFRSRYTGKLHQWHQYLSRFHTLFRFEKLNQLDRRLTQLQTTSTIFLLPLRPSACITSSEKSHQLTRMYQNPFNHSWFGCRGFNVGRKKLNLWRSHTPRDVDAGAAMDRQFDGHHVKLLLVLNSCSYINSYLSHLWPFANVNLLLRVTVCSSCGNQIKIIALVAAIVLLSTMLT